MANLGQFIKRGPIRPQIIDMRGMQVCQWIFKETLEWDIQECQVQIVQIQT